MQSLKNNPIDACNIKRIIDKHSRDIPSTLGQNWLIYGQQPDPSQKEEAIAQTCYAALNLFPAADWTKDLQGDGTWQRARFFELSHPDIEADGENRSHHVVIFVFPHSETETEFNQSSSQIFPHLIPLFYYRNKILVANELREQSKQSLKYDAMSLGLKPLETYVKTMTNIIEMERTKNERSLNQIVAIGGGHQRCFPSDGYRCRSVQGYCCHPLSRRRRKNSYRTS
ncbi:MAG: hypothetical protein AAGD25_14030 [Cyanobacteria bacterium P01_F01_bin.150]